jgi:hypothetical protein
LIPSPQLFTTPISALLPGMVAHTCNSSYLGSWDQEDRGLRPAQANSSQDSHLQNKLEQNGLVVRFKQ